MNLNRLRRLNYRHVLPDILVMVLSLYLSLFWRVSQAELGSHLLTLNKLLPIFVLLRLSTLIAAGVYNIIWRYVSLEDVWKLIKGVLLSALIIIAATYLMDIGRLPRSIFVIDTVLVLLGMAGFRMGRRMVFDRVHKRRSLEHGRRTLIVGAAHNGRTLALRLNTDPTLNMKLIGFLDDDSEKIGRQIGGVKVLASIDSLSDVIREHAIQEVIVAISKPSGELLRKLVQTTRGFSIRPKLFSQVTEGKSAHVELTRSIDLQDLMNRPSRQLEIESIDKLLRGKRVLITGAGGSIGSEISRQVMKFSPTRLMILDHSEYNLYEIDKELRVNQGHTDTVVPLLNDIKDLAALETVMKSYRPEVVFHAAAYKHVHLVEANPYSSILNNIQGTKNVIDLSVEVGVENFVLISTDKAVRPAGVMGATKRVCELMIAAAGTKTDGKYCAVRFGNVLGSSGSLIPLLQEQILSGQPITITHADMARYFMLIPEAVSLVLKAATLAGPGDISILKMGEPIKILELAKSLIALMGKTEDEVPIVFTGIRPGEKIVEELYLCGDEVNTSHPDILLAPKGDQSELNEEALGGIEGAVRSIIKLAHEH
ncbi:MAG: nucleoside-diphosphate sugar epimerase/dehydratase, partial [Bdellovibrionia bacterium]